MKLARALAGERISVETMPVVMAQAPRWEDASGTTRDSEANSLTPEEASALEDATLGLVSLGYRKTDAGPRARRALDALRAGGKEITSETLLEAALR